MESVVAVSGTYRDAVTGPRGGRVVRPVGTLPFLVEHLDGQTTLAVEAEIDAANVDAFEAILDVVTKADTDAPSRTVATGRRASQAQPSGLGTSELVAPSPVWAGVGHRVPGLRLVGSHSEGPGDVVPVPFGDERRGHAAADQFADDLIDSPESPKRVRLEGDLRHRAGGINELVQDRRDVLAFATEHSGNVLVGGHRPLLCVLPAGGASTDWSHVALRPAVWQGPCRSSSAAVEQPGSAPVCGEPLVKGHGAQTPT